jgi:hypothetical protein
MVARVVDKKSGSREVEVESLRTEHEGGRVCWANQGKAGQKAKSWYFKGVKLHVGKKCV